jgi:phage shock protein A
MSYFSRLTEIVTCNLTEVLSIESDPAAALPRIIAEMEEGLQGAMRSVGAATASADRIDKEIGEHRRQISDLTSQAKAELAAGREQDARGMLVWKREIEDVVAGLQQQHQAACNTRDHLTTTLRAVESRLADARRRLTELGAQLPAAPRAGNGGPMGRPLAAVAAARARDVEAELESLKREMGH